MTVAAVIFDWGGTLTPWHTIDHIGMWSEACAPHYPGGAHAEVARKIAAAEQELWRAAGHEHRSATIYQVLDRAGVPATGELLASYLRVWEPHTFTDPEAAAVLRALRRRGVKIGVLSNTMWPRAWHEDVFRRDGVAGLIDAAVYSSEIEWTKPHPRAFLAAMDAVGVTDPASCVFVGDRPFDDVHGAKRAGMRAVLMGNSEVPAFASAEPDAVITRLPELHPLIEAW